MNYSAAPMRLRLVLLALVAALAVVPAAHADTPYLDHVAKELEARAPGTKGKVWWISQRNTLPPGWLLQTPNCWGFLACSQPPPGANAFLRRVTEMIAGAQVSVDFSGLYPPPDGRFLDAIVDGLNAARANGHRPTIRMLIGRPPQLAPGRVSEEALRPIAQLLLTEELVTRFGIERITRFQLGVPVAGRRRLRVEWLPSTRNRAQVMQRREVSGTLTL
jgi:hypothetical protein